MTKFHYRGNTVPAIRRIPGRYYLAIFVLACATLSYQILITRFFSVMLYYHFAFAAISLAMLGLTRGAMAVYNNPGALCARPGRTRNSRATPSWFAISGVGAMIAFLCVPLVVPADSCWARWRSRRSPSWSRSRESGICITLLLTRLPYGGGWLYARRPHRRGARLSRRHLRPAGDRSRQRHALASAPLPPAPAGWWSRGSGDVRSLRLSGAVALSLAAAASCIPASTPPARAISACSGPRATSRPNTLFERWNTYSRVRVTAARRSTSVRLGLRPDARDDKIDQNYLDIDADAATVITRFDGDLRKLGLPQGRRHQRGLSGAAADATSRSSASAAAATFCPPCCSAPRRSPASRSIRRSSRC